MMRFIVLTAAALLAVFVTSQAYALNCGTRLSVLAALENLGETVAEQGVDQSGVWVGITVDPESLRWTFVMTPKFQPKLLCIVGTGSEWSQASGGSNGILYDGSVIVVSFDTIGNWKLSHIESGLEEPAKVTSQGYGWERLTENI